MANRCALAKRLPRDKQKVLTGSPQFARYMPGQAMRKSQAIRKPPELVHSQLPAVAPRASNIDFGSEYFAQRNAERSLGPELKERGQSPLRNAPEWTGQRSLARARGPQIGA